MTIKNTVLSLNPDGTMLLSHEAALRAGGFEVISARSAIDARFEIEKGACSVFLTTHITPVPIFRDLVNLFRRNRPGGLVVFISNSPRETVTEADVVLSESDDAFRRGTLADLLHEQMR